ncbi:MAG: FAD:protein FMN transferase [Muribaculaceae bacterium]|nr:FAD:protein FMN transferase [Muribaculaceae bacterium]
MMLRRPYSLWLLAVIAACVAGCTRQAPQWHRDEGATWGTTYHIVYESTSNLHDSVRAVMSAVDASVSPFNPASRLSAVNAGRSDTLDAMLRSLMAESQRVCRLSGGAFDPTVMPLVDLWGFGPSGRGVEPSREQIDSALAAVGILDCTVDDAGRLTLKSPGTRLDFSAIAKGMGVDMVAAMLRHNGVENYMVEIGGEVALGGTNPRGKNWHIQIDAPVDDALPGHSGMRVAEIGGGSCVATSGNYRNYRTLADGTHAGHIISPMTGMPVHTSVLSATVVAPSCTTADALATAAMAMQPDSALALARRASVEMLLAVAAADSFAIRTTPGFP